MSLFLIGIASESSLSTIREKKTQNHVWIKGSLPSSEKSGKKIILIEIDQARACRLHSEDPPILVRHTEKDLCVLFPRRQSKGGHKDNVTASGALGIAKLS